MPTVTAIYRYPVKGLTPEPLERTTLTAGETIPFDRAYAIENGPSAFDETAPRHLPKVAFLMLMRNERLAALRTRFDDASATLSVRLNGEMKAEGRLDTEAGRRTIAEFFAGYCADELRGPPRVVHADGFSLSDVAAKVVSLINMESVRALERHAGRPVDPLRFRGNLLVDGMPAWAEFELVGKRVKIGDAILEGTKRIMRCAATEVDPATAARDLKVPALLDEAFGHSDCGTYLRVVAGGTIGKGDTLSLI